MRSLPLLLTTAALLAACAKTTPPPAAPTAAPQSHDVRNVSVSTAAQLQSALTNALPGDIITMADGTYTGFFTIPSGVSGTSTNHIILTGSKKCLVQTNTRTSGNAALFLLGNSYWEFRNFTVMNSKKGIMVDYSSNNTFDDMSIRLIGEEGIHFRRNSTYNVLKNSFIKQTGTEVPDYGEGCYIGSAESNWGTYTGGNPDLCDHNTVQGTLFGPDVAAENIDIKEGTSYGTISGNTFSAVGLSGANSADSWLDVKGNSYTISGNTGTNGGTVLLDGYQTHQVLSPWGQNNIFSNNISNVSAAGYAIRIQKTGSSPVGNVVYASNTATGAALGLTNITVTP